MSKVLTFSICTMMILTCAHYSAEELLSAPETIEIDGREYILDTYLWRDFMPPPPYSGIYGIISIIAVDSLEFPSSLNAPHIWVIMDDDVWESDLTDQHIPASKTYILEARLESKDFDWGPEIFVSTVVEIVDDNNNTYLLRADSQWIAAVY